MFLSCFMKCLVYVLYKKVNSVMIKDLMYHFRNKIILEIQSWVAKNFLKLFNTLGVQRQTLMAGALIGCLRTEMCCRLWNGFAVLSADKMYSLMMSWKCRFHLLYIYWRGIIKLVFYRFVFWTVDIWLKGVASSLV